MMGPEQHSIVTGAVQSLDRVMGEFRKTECVQRQVRESLLDVCFDVRPGGDVVRVPEHPDIRVKSLKGMLGVLSPIRLVLGGYKQPK